MRHAKQFKVSRRKFGGRLHRSLLGCYYRLTYLPDSRAGVGAGAGAQWKVERGTSRRQAVAPGPRVQRLNGTRSCFAVVVVAAVCRSGNGD